MKDNKDKLYLKRKKIRRLLLLKTDEELKKVSKKKCNIMINSKTIQEMNKSYNIYNILLSEESKIYSNYVKTEEKIVRNKIFETSITIQSVRELTREKTFEKPIKLINSIFEEDSIIPIISYLPKKIDLGKRKFSSLKKDSLQISIQITDKNNMEKELSNEDKMNKSTRVEKRRLYRLVDKILILKMKEDEDVENIIKKNIIKLRKYCSKFIIKKKKIKKVKKTKNIKNIKENYKRKSHAKRMTVNVNKSFFIKSLFGSKDIKTEGHRTDSRIGTMKYPNIRLKEISDISNKKKSKTKKEKKIISSKMIKTKNYDKNSEIDKNDLFPSPTKKISKEILMSSKFQRPSKFLFNNINAITNNPINNNSNNIKRVISKTKISSFFGNSKILINKDKKGNIISFFNSKEKNKGYNKEKSPIKKNKKNHIKIYENYSRNNDKYEINKLKEKFTLNKEDVINTNFLSEFRKKKSKKNNNRITSQKD